MPERGLSCENWTSELVKSSSGKGHQGTPKARGQRPAPRSSGWWVKDPDVAAHRFPPHPQRNNVIIWSGYAMLASAEILIST